MVKWRALLFIFIFLPLLGRAKSVPQVGATPPTATPATDKELLLQARQLYEKNDLNQAIQIYSQLSPTSDFWLEALEERAWAYTRQENYQKALADLKSITHPVWSEQIGPESIMLSAFVSLKTCAYKDTLEKLDLFKKRMSPRVDALEKLQTNPVSAEMSNLLEKAAANQLHLSNLGKSAALYPRYFFRDQILLNAFTAKNISLVKTRLQALADRDLKEIQNNLVKMKVIEIEVIQRVATANRTKQTNNDLKFDRYDKSKQVSFPLSDDEVWLDEMGSFEVKARACAQSH